MINPLDKYKEIPPFVEFGYEPKTTFWGDFGVADVFSTENNTEPILDTFNRAFENYKDDKDYGTELAMVLNHKAWEHYSKDHDKITDLYTDLFHKLDGYIMENWDRDKLDYYVRTTD